MTTYNHKPLSPNASLVVQHLVNNGIKYFNKKGLEKEFIEIDDFSSIWKELYEKDFIERSIFYHTLPLFGWQINNPFRDYGKHERR